MSVALRFATADDCATILRFIRELAEFEKLAHEVIATEDRLRTTLFGETPAAEVIIATLDDAPVGFALFFTNYSTFLAQPGLYLEDLYVTPSARGAGIATALLATLAQLVVARGYGRFEWSVLDWNENAIALYRKLGAVPQDEWTVQRLTGDALAALAARAVLVPR